MNQEDMIPDFSDLLSCFLLLSILISNEVDQSRVIFIVRKFKSRCSAHDSFFKRGLSSFSFFLFFWWFQFRLFFVVIVLIKVVSF